MMSGLSPAVSIIKSSRNASTGRRGFRCVFIRTFQPRVFQASPGHRAPASGAHRSGCVRAGELRSQFRRRGPGRHAGAGPYAGPAAAGPCGAVAAAAAPGGGMTCAWFAIAGGGCPPMGTGGAGGGGQSAFRRRMRRAGRRVRRAKLYQPAVPAMMPSVPDAFGKKSILYWIGIVAAGSTARGRSRSACSAPRSANSASKKSGGKTKTGAASGPMRAGMKHLRPDPPQHDPSLARRRGQASHSGQPKTGRNAI